MNQQQPPSTWQQWDHDQQNQFSNQFILPLILFSWRNFSLRYIISVVLEQLVHKKVIILDTTQFQTDLISHTTSYKQKKMVQQMMQTREQEQTDEFVSSCSPYYSSNRIYVFSEEKFHYRIAFLRLLIELLHHPTSPYFQPFKQVVQSNQSVMHKCLFLLFQTGASLLIFHPKYTLTNRFKNKTLKKLWSQQSLFHNWMKKKMPMEFVHAHLEAKYS